MIALDEDALICDFAETYHIFDYKSLDVELAATLATGLRKNSRIMMKINGLEVELNTLLLARICDSAALNVYAKTKDARHNRNRPKSMVDALLHRDSDKVEYKRFENGKDFMVAWRELNG